MSIKKRSAVRRKKIVVNRAQSFEEAERWDLDYWQSLTPEDRLSALVALHQDYIKIKGKNAGLILSDEED